MFTQIIVHTETEEKNVLLQEHCKRGHDNKGKNMTVHNKYIVTHSLVECSLGQNIHTRISKLQENYTYEWLQSVKQFLLITSHVVSAWD